MPFCFSRAQYLFKPLKNKADFILLDIEIGTGGKAYVTTTNMSRSPDRSDGKSWIDNDGDSGSEKEILPYGAKPMGIVMTTAFTVQSDNVKL
jgi:hypothetical protein